MPIVDHVLRNGSVRGIQAIVVYPMNALANSQHEELGKFIDRGYGQGERLVRFKRYTGQERGDARDAIRADPPDILLTNYMMLELLLTRREDRELVRAARGLRFLVFDELHTYRGRQGADVAMLIRRCRHAFGNDLLCVGTSATMARRREQRRAEARSGEGVAGALRRCRSRRSRSSARPSSGRRRRSTSRTLPLRPGARSAMRSPRKVRRQASTRRSAATPSHPGSSRRSGIREEAGTGRLLRQVPRRLEGEPVDGRPSAAAELSELTGADAGRCARVLRSWLLQGSNLYRTESSRFPIFAFRLHQFLTRGDTVWATLEPAAHRHLEIAKLAAKPGEPEKPLFPLVFCRRCGTEYYRVRTSREERGEVLLPPRGPPRARPRRRRGRVPSSLLRGVGVAPHRRAGAPRTPAGRLQGNQ